MKGVLAKMKAVVMNFPLQKFIHNVFEEVKKKQDEILRKKTNFLYREAYRYFLDLYLIKVASEKRVDIPAFFYEQGIVTFLVVLIAILLLSLLRKKSAQINKQILPFLCFLCYS